MDPGRYIARFHTPLDDASGVIFIQGDDVYGGDTAMYYIGRITGENGKITVTLRVRQHDRERISVFGEIEDFILSLTGKRKGEDYVFEGRADRAPSIRFNATLSRAPA